MWLTGIALEACLILPRENKLINNYKRTQLNVNILFYVFIKRHQGEDMHLAINLITLITRKEVALVKFPVASTAGIVTKQSPALIIATIL